MYVEIIGKLARVSCLLPPYPTRTFCEETPIISFGNENFYSLNHLTSSAKAFHELSLLSAPKTENTKFMDSFASPLIIFWLN